MLCDMLAQTRVAGKPNSFFRQKSLLDWSESWKINKPCDPEDTVFTRHYLDAMRVEGRDGTDVFGLRLMGPDTEFALDWLART